MMESRYHEILIYFFGILGTAIEIVTGPSWSHWIAAAVIVFVAFWMLHLDKRLRVLRHINDVVPHFDEDKLTIASCRSRYAYLGVSGRTVYNAFETIVKSRAEHLHARILLIHPFTEHVLSNLRIMQPQADQAAADHHSHVIEVQAQSFLNLNVGALTVEVRFYQADLHYWLHLVDDREAIVGVRLIGDHGQNPPALRLRHMRDADNPIFKLFREEFDTLWESPHTVDANAYFAKKAGAGAP